MASRGKPLDDSTRQMIRRLASEGSWQRIEIARRCGVCRMTVWKYLGRRNAAKTP